jgi:hypothetical protein
LCQLTSPILRPVSYLQLEGFLIANRDEYLKHSSKNYTMEQKQYNNWLTERLMDVAAKHHYVFDKEDFNFVAIRDRIRCYYKSYVQTARKRGLPLPTTLHAKKKDGGGGKGPSASNSDADEKKGGDDDDEEDDEDADDDDEYNENHEGDDDLNPPDRNKSDEARGGDKDEGPKVSNEGGKRSPSEERPPFGTSNDVGTNTAEAAEAAKDK